MKKFFCWVFLAVYSLNLAALDDQKPIEKMKWFDEARLGIFIHWGIYAVNGIDEFTTATFRILIICNN